MKNTSLNESKIDPKLFRNDDINTRPELVRLKHRYGTLYGALIGLTFAISTWGADSYILSQSHALLPWLKIILGGLFCSLVGAFAGWITARIERWYFTIPAWLGVAAFFAWILITLPLQIDLFISTVFRPELKGLIVGHHFSELVPRFWVAFGWIIIFTLITGAIQIPYIEPAAFSVSMFGKIAPFLLGMFMIGLGGFITDSLNNEPLRSAVVAMDHSIQFVLDNQGVDVDPAVSRANHAGSLRSIKDQVTSKRYIAVSGYDVFLGEVDLAVHFNDLIANCTVIYSQPVFCKPAAQN